MFNTLQIFVVLLKFNQPSFWVWTVWTGGYSVQNAYQLEQFQITNFAGQTKLLVPQPRTRNKSILYLPAFSKTFEQREAACFLNKNVFWIFYSYS